MTSVAGLPEVLDTSREELPRVIEGIVGEHLARELDKVGFTFFKGGKEVDFIYRVEVKWGSASLRDLRTERGFDLSADELRLGGKGYSPSFGVPLPDLVRQNSVLALDRMTHV